MKKERNKILTQIYIYIYIHNEIKKEKKEKKFKTIDDLIVEPNDSRKMFSAVKKTEKNETTKTITN